MRPARTVSAAAAAPRLVLLALLAAAAGVGPCAALPGPAPPAARGSHGAELAGQPGLSQASASATSGGAAPSAAAGVAYPRIAIIPGMTLCNVETRAWYAWLRGQLAGPPLYLNVTLK
jgi:hypothetical protein